MKPVLRFGWVIAVIGVIWLVILPKLGQTAALRSMIERNQAASVDPSAMFYTDVEHLKYRNGMLRRES